MRKKGERRCEACEIETNYNVLVCTAYGQAKMIKNLESDKDLVNLLKEVRGFISSITLIEAYSHHLSFMIVIHIRNENP